MKKQTKKKKKWGKWLVYFLVFCAGMILSPNPGPNVVTKEVVKESCSSEALWRELKLIDDQGFTLASEGFGIVSDTFFAVSELDWDTVSENIEKMSDKTDEMEIVSSKMSNILSKLGY